MNTNEAVLTEDGLSVPGLEASLALTLEYVRALHVSDLLEAGWTIRDLVQVVATTPPFNDVLVKQIEQCFFRRGNS